MAFECIRSLSIEGQDGAPPICQIVEVPSLLEDSMSLVSAGLDGKVRHVIFNRINQSHQFLSSKQDSKMYNI